MPLRKIHDGDLELMLTWRNNKVIRSSMFSQSQIEIDQHRAWFQRESAKKDSLWLFYIDSEENPAGVVYFTNMNQNSSNAFWGFYAAPEAMPGTGTRMATEALDHFFWNLAFHKLNAEVIESNNRSQQFHRKLGFQVEGVLRDQYLTKEGYQSVIRFGLLDTEWDIYRKRSESN